jgi:hypothetical protein
MGPRMVFTPKGFLFKDKEEYDRFRDHVNRVNYEHENANEIAKERARRSDARSASRRQPNEECQLAQSLRSWELPQQPAPQQPVPQTSSVNEVTSTSSSKEPLYIFGVLAFVLYLVYTSQYA